MSNFGHNTELGAPTPFEMVQGAIDTANTYASGPHVNLRIVTLRMDDALRVLAELGRLESDWYSINLLRAQNKILRDQIDRMTAWGDGLGDAWKTVSAQVRNASSDPTPNAQVKRTPGAFPGVPLEPLVGPDAVAIQRDSETYVESCNQLERKP